MSHLPNRKWDKMDIPTPNTPSPVEEGKTVRFCSEVFGTVHPALCESPRLLSSRVLISLRPSFLPAARPATRNTSGVPPNLIILPRLRLINPRVQSNSPTANRPPRLVSIGVTRPTYTTRARVGDWPWVKRGVRHVKRDLKIDGFQDGVERFAGRGRNGNRSDRRDGHPA